MYNAIIGALILSTSLSIILALILTKLGEKNRAGNLYVMVRGGTPRAVGLAPFITLLLFLPYPFKDLVAVMGILAFLDDVLGRKKSSRIPVEWGQIFRGMGMILVVIIGYPYLGIAAILVALMIQPMNIADMQPGSACSSIIAMSLLVIFLMIFQGNTTFLLVPSLLLAVCVGYAPLDYKGKVMLGEVGNHSMAIVLGLSFFLLGGLSGLTIMFLVNVIWIAFLRRKNLHIFLEKKLSIKNPTGGDYFMDVLTGGGMVDLIRKIVLKNKQIIIKNRFLIKLGFRRLLYNPFARE
ncbi:cell wall biosynthesis protein [Methanobacterium alkalithermotolerans]|uniref:Cell wall biosynthesis protein n=1 Tax=Methanobacterium alkalithermotolerans TaxID=2731220 RepID=A0A8T8K6I4_9EURY|nr:cell wall biosynthesis protein [Methanobacterium alkalithermotolerans]QUH23637.1 cell wall biosynthesis protein [Methanobacterium alkalithermotolerans]RJS49806.1 MAG: cell wall biosynthesis protein [Methanobacterium sp.]